MRIQYGFECGHCHGRCVDPPTEELPLRMRCPSCDALASDVDGRIHCDACGDCGEYLVTECPKRYVKQDVADLLMAADLAKQGNWPVGNGWLNNAQPCIDAIRFAWGDQAHAKAEIAERK